VTPFLEFLQKELLPLAPPSPQQFFLAASSCLASMLEAALLVWLPLIFLLPPHSALDF
jgi:hypothetical protein